MTDSPATHPSTLTELLIASIRDYAIYMLDPQGMVISWNAGAQRFKGYAAQEIVGQHFSRFHIPEDQAAGVPARALATARANGKFECEGWRVRKDGSRFWASVVIDPVHRPDGSFAGFAKITRDITEKKAAADALFASEQQFRLLVQGVVDYAIYMLSPEGVVTNWNNGARRIKGYEAADIIGHHFSSFYTDEERAAGVPALALAEATAHGRYEAEGRRVRKDGSIFWAHVVIDAIRDDHGTLIGFAKITRDVTDRKRAEVSLEQARAELFQSQKMDAMGQLTGGIAHDFNNLLSIVSSGVQILSHQTLTAQQLLVVDTIQRAVDRGSAMTQQLLAFARQQPLAPENHRINQIIERFEPVLRRAVTSAIDFRTRLDPEAGWLHIDEARFEAALLNLVVNARDAMPAGGTLDITTERMAPETPGAPAHVRVSVADSGSGMDAAVLARVFEPFYTTKEIGKGTGLGLSQVQGFIVQSGGQISIDSAPDSGTRVHMRLPAIAAPAQSTTAQSASELVIIVEDEPELAGLAKSLFETLGYVALVAHNGPDALRLLAQHPDTDLLFSDVMMPGMNGIALAHAARALYPAMKIILASGYAALALREQGNIDAFDFVAKPYRLSEIVRKLR